MFTQAQRLFSEQSSYHYEDPLCFNKLNSRVYSFLLEMNQDYSRDIIYLCIGTDRATGDCLGPLVGSRLKSLIPSALIYGTLERPAHATNLLQVLERLEADYRTPLVVAIDACLGNTDRIGFINVKKGSLKPGKALNRELPAVGDFHVSGVVNAGGMLEHLVLQSTRLFTVYKMAEIISKGLSMAHCRFEQQRPLL